MIKKLKFLDSKQDVLDKIKKMESHLSSYREMLNTFDKLEKFDKVKNIKVDNGYLVSKDIEAFYKYADSLESAPAITRFGFNYYTFFIPCIKIKDLDLTIMTAPYSESAFSVDDFYLHNCFVPFKLKKLPNWHSLPKNIKINNYEDFFDKFTNKAKFIKKVETTITKVIIESVKKIDDFNKIILDKDSYNYEKFSAIQLLS